MNPDPLRAGSGDREPAGRETTHRANGLGGRDGTAAAPGREAEAEGTGNAAKKPGRRARARKRGGRGGRGGRDDDDDTRTVFPSRDVRGDAAAHDARTGPDLGVRGESSTGAPAAAPEVKKHASGGYLTARHPTRCGGGSPHETRLPGGRRRGRKSPQTHLSRRDPPPRRRRRTSAKPPSLARFPKRAKLASRTLSHGPRRRDRRARRRRRKSPPAATGPDASGDAPGDDRPPFSPKAAPEREVTTPQSQNRIPDPEEGTGQPLLPNRGNAAGEGERGDLHTARNGSDARTRRARRGRGPRERQRRGSAGGTARGGHRRWTGGAREPTATQPRSSRSAPRPDRGAYAPSGERGETGVPRHSGVRARGPLVPRHG